MSDQNEQKAWRVPYTGTWTFAVNTDTWEIGKIYPPKSEEALPIALAQVSKTVRALVEAFPI